MKKPAGIALLFVAGGLLLTAFLQAQKPDFRSDFISAGLSPRTPAFRLFSVDSLGRGKLEGNPILKEDAPAGPFSLETGTGGAFAYMVKAPDGRRAAAWTFAASGKTITLRSEYVAGTEAASFLLAFDQRANHATLLGLMKPGERRMALPCILHLPDKGSVRITSSRPGASLDYDARRYVKAPFVRIAFLAASAASPRVDYNLEVVEIHPDVPKISSDPLFDGFRRSYLNLFQVNPRVQMLANNASSDPVPFTLYMAAELAASAPPLAQGLSCLDLVRMTLDRYLSGAKGYGMIGYAVEPGDADLVAWKAPWNSLDTLPSLLQAACVYVSASRDMAWARSRYERLAGWARDMMASDKDGNGLIEHPHTGNSGDRATADRRPSNWWDTINFGHEDAYANALAFRACSLFAGLARDLGHREAAEEFEAKAAKLKRAYASVFLNPATGLIAGWKSADGKLHDYAFTFVNGIAIDYGLLSGRQANAVMDRLLAKMSEVGFSEFRYGLPGNLLPVRKADYVFHNWSGAREIGEPMLEDGSDAFQIYENGGATACYAYFTIHALYALGRAADAHRIFDPMLRSYAAGDFQGFCDNGKSKDWRDWKGGCHGYEGLLTDGFLPLLCVLDDVKAKR